MVAAPGRALANVGETVQGIGIKFNEGKERDDNFEAERMFIQFKEKEERRLDEESRNMPEGGEGFTQSWRTGYDAGAKEVFGQARTRGLNPKALHTLDTKLLTHGEQYTSAANRRELTERDRHHTSIVTSELDSRVAAATENPDRIQERLEEGFTLIDNSRLAPRARAIARRDFAVRAISSAETARATVDPEAAIDRLSQLPRGLEGRIGVSGEPEMADPTSMVEATEQPADITGARRTEAAPGDTPERPAAAPGARPRAQAPAAPIEFKPLPGGREGRAAGAIRGGKPVGIVLHHTAGDSLESAINTNLDKGTGYNVLVDKDGTPYLVAPEDKYTAHMQPMGRNDPFGNRTRNGEFPHLNPDNTLSISAVASNDAAITPEQRQTMTRIAQGWAQQFGIKPENIIGHGDVQHGVRGRAGRERAEGSMALEFREGRIPLSPGEDGTRVAGSEPRYAQANIGTGATRNDASGTALPPGPWKFTDQPAYTLEEMPIKDRQTLIRNIQTGQRNVIRHELQNAILEINNGRMPAADPRTGRTVLDRARTIMTPNQFAGWRLKFEDAVSTREAVAPLTNMSEAEARAHVINLPPRIRARAEKVWDRIAELDNKDPARVVSGGELRGVDSLPRVSAGPDGMPIAHEDQDGDLRAPVAPEVTQVYAELRGNRGLRTGLRDGVLVIQDAANPYLDDKGQYQENGNPQVQEAWRKLFDARLAAQTRRGIREPRILTRAEATDLLGMGPERSYSDADQYEAAAREAFDRARARFGPQMAVRAMKEALQQRANVSTERQNVWRNLATSQFGPERAPTAIEKKQLQNLERFEREDQAIQGWFRTPQMRDDVESSQGRGSRRAPFTASDVPATPPAPVPARAPSREEVQALFKNRGNAEAIRLFERRFGKGAAAETLMVIERERQRTRGAQE